MIFIEGKFMSESKQKQNSKKTTSTNTSSSSSSAPKKNSALIQKKSKDHSSMFGSTPIQKKTNKNGLPNDLKAGMENLSGKSMDDVKVHKNSAKPAQVQAHAYAQGSDIHLASGQEKQLPHELAHVVQQKQGRVKPTTKANGAAVNDDKNLEKEADKMGDKALKKK